MPTNTRNDPALREASQRAKERQAAKFAPAKRLWESGRSLKANCGAIGVDEGTIRKWAAEHGWVRGEPE
jgi:uncharacterized protein YjcR